MNARLQDNLTWMSGNEAIAFDPENIAILDSYANFLFRQSRFDEAIRQWQTVIRLAPDNFAALVNLGSALSETGRIAEAITVYQRAIELRPEVADPYYNQGNVYAYLGELLASRGYIAVSVDENFLNSSFADLVDLLGPGLEEESGPGVEPTVRGDRREAEGIDPRHDCLPPGCDLAVARAPPSGDRRLLPRRAHLGRAGPLPRCALR